MKKTVAYATVSKCSLKTKQRLVSRNELQTKLMQVHKLQGNLENKLEVQALGLLVSIS